MAKAISKTKVFDGCASELFTYSLLKSGPEVNARDVEVPDSLALEVIVLWGSSVLHVSHSTPPQNFTLGESTGEQGTCDFFIPEEVLGATQFALVTTSEQSINILIPPGAKGFFEIPGELRMSLAEARRRGTPSMQVVGGFELPLPASSRASIQLSDFTFQVATVNAGKPSKRGLSAGVEGAVFSYFGLSLAAIGSLVTAMAFLVPPQGMTDDESFRDDQVYVIQQYLQASAERESETKPTDQVADVDADNKEGGTGTRSKGEEGSLGDQHSKATKLRYGVQGPRDNPGPHISRQIALDEARKFGLIGMLNSLPAGDPNTPTAPWGRDNALGRDDMSARGNMWGDVIGAAFGSGGLGLSGLGEGAGGIGEGIGLGNIGTLGNGSGTGPGRGFGVGHGRLGTPHHTKVPSVRPGRTTVSGRLPPEVIQRIVRQNYGRFRNCYEQGLSKNPNLEGRVEVRFAIGRDGTVSNVQRGNSDLPDSGVVNCVIGAYYGLNFPQPEGGIVTVVYPIMFQPG